MLRICFVSDFVPCSADMWTLLHYLILVSKSCQAQMGHRMRQYMLGYRYYCLSYWFITHRVARLRRHQLYHAPSAFQASLPIQLFWNIKRGALAERFHISTTKCPKVMKRDVKAGCAVYVRSAYFWSSWNRSGRLCGAKTQSLECCWFV